MQDGRLQVVVDARFWRPTIQTGVERYVALLAEAVAASGAPVDLAVVVAPHGGRSDAGGLRLPDIDVLPVPDQRERSMAEVLARFAPAVVHYPFDLPPALTHPSVFTLHDAGRYLYPELMVRRIREVQNARLRTHLAHPNLRSVITVSRTSVGDIVDALGPLPCPLHVVPNFVTAPFRSLLQRPRTTRSGPDAYLLAVGVYIPTKNIPFLCRAFRLAKAAAPAVVPPRLMLAGRIGWERHLPVGDSSDVTVTGHVSDHELAALYAEASAFVFPSFYEGFGIPVLEALTAGTRVLCADIPVFREIGRDLVQYADPRDEEAFAAAIIRRCQTPVPDRPSLDRLLSQYSAAAAGRALAAAYRAAATPAGDRLTAPGPATTAR